MFERPVLIRVARIVPSPWGAPLLGSPKPVADSHAKDAPRQIPSNFRTSPWKSIKVTEFEHRQLAAVRKELDQEYEALIGLKAKPPKDANPVKISSSSKTCPHVERDRASAQPITIP
jgi:hypothetical protein